MSQTDFAPFVILSDERRTTTRKVEVRVGKARRRLDFVQYLGGQWEVYNFPRSWKGLPQFVGYLPPRTALRLEALLEERAARSVAA